MAGKRKVGSPASVNQVTLSDLMPSWARSLEARNLAPLSIFGYTQRVWRFVHWLQRTEQPEAVGAITKATIERYMADDLRAGAAAKSVAIYHGALKVFFTWCVEEGEITRSPVAGVQAPMAPAVPPPLLRDADLEALLKSCEGSNGPTFLARRDAAILRLLLDSGLRLSELAGMTLASLDLAAGEATVQGKGRKPRTVAFHAKTANALDRYLRIRQRHADAAKAALWLGGRGGLSTDGIYQMVKRRAVQAGITANVWPHLLRHCWAHQWLREGGQEHALMKMAGWSSSEMVGRYGAELAEERAREAAKRMRGADRL